LCLQEVHGQDVEGRPRDLVVLKELLGPTRYADYQIRSTTLKDKPDVERFRNLVTLVRPDMTFLEAREIHHEFAPPPQYNFVTPIDQDEEDDVAKDIRWDRPLFYTKVETDGRVLHVLNVHYKSKIPTPIPTQGPRDFKWRSAAGWAEGYFISSMKRVGAALETRIFVDKILEEEPEALIVLCGDFNAENDEVPMAALRGEVADTGNPDLHGSVLYALENSVPEDQRFTLFHHGERNMLDHLLVSRGMLGAYLGTEIHNEIVRDESVAFAFDVKFPSSDHAPIVADFDFSLLPGPLV
ncbi:MAG: endonuclease/exonuclease/phosphatase family protein, partial [Pseudomonadota bacterium]